MAWGGLILTNAGRNLLAKVQAGTIASLNITRFGMGDGSYSGSYSTITNLVSQKQSVPLRAKKAKDNYVNIEGYFSNEGLASGFYFREWGIFAMNGAQEILYAYDNAGADAEYIAPDGSIRYEKLLKAALAISADTNVTINTSGVVYVTAEELEERLSNISSKAADISVEDTAGHFASDNVEGALAELFQSVSNGKATVAGAITDKGVPTSPTATFQTMADNIEAIETDPSVGTTNAVPSDVLAPKKVVSQGQLFEGTMPSRGPAAAETVELTSQNQEYTIASGFHTGLRKIKAVITGLVASVIAMGATAGGIAGTFTSDANATAAQMLSGVIAYVKGVKIIGTILSKAAQTYTPGTINQTIAAGQYLSGAQIIEGSQNLLPENIKDGVNIFGKVGNVKPTQEVTTEQVKLIADNTTWSASMALQYGIFADKTYSIKGSDSLTITDIFFKAKSGYKIIISCPQPVLMTILNNFYQEIRYKDKTTYLDSHNSGIGTARVDHNYVIIYNPNRIPITLTANSENTWNDVVQVYTYIK